MNHLTHPLIFANISIFSSEIRKFWYIKKYRYKSGNNLESQGSVRKNKKKRHLELQKGTSFGKWQLLVLRYPYLKPIFGIFRLK